jgi:Ca-activated chloride channel family protein
MRLVVVTTLVGVLVAAVVVAQRAPGRATESPRPLGRLEGVVTGRRGPISGAGVDLRGSREFVRNTRTDTAGRFSFSNVPAGLYEVEASSEGLVPVVMHVVVGNQPVAALEFVLGVSLAESRDLAALRHAQMTAARRTRDASPGVSGGVAGGAVGVVPFHPSAPQPVRVGGNFMPALPEFNTASYDRIVGNAFKRVADEPLSTFSIDVDTASYANVRRFLNQGTLPPADAVRVEELVNYFRYDFGPRGDDTPFSVHTEVGRCPWNPSNKLVLVGVGAESPRGQIPARNLVFLLDVSGSMQPAARLPLVKTAMRMLADTLTARDRVAIVVYAGGTGLALPSTPGDRKAEIDRAISELAAGGSTNGAAGIRLAYDTAAESFIKGGVNRVILATDGDFNVGVTSQGELVRLIEEQRKRGIFLSVLGVGDDNLKDSTMEKLADVGNGNYAYLDSLQEARRVLIAESNATMIAVAKDVKLQVEFNPQTVAAYRLVGYENRLLNKEDFNDDTKDAGELGAGHTVTALYEVVPHGVPVPGPSVDPLKYQEAPKLTGRAASSELMTVKIRYKAPAADTSRLVNVVVSDKTAPAGRALGFASAVAEFGMLLRDSAFKGTATWASAQALAREHKGEDPDGLRGEFIRLVDLAAALSVQQDVLPQTRR